VLASIAGTVSPRGFARLPTTTPAIRIELLLFFFQAEDGIRDLYVTGVQTCALPICIRIASSSGRRTRAGDSPRGSRRTSFRATATAARSGIAATRAAATTPRWRPLPQAPPRSPPPAARSTAVAPRSHGKAAARGRRFPEAPRAAHRRGRAHRRRGRSQSARLVRPSHRRLPLVGETRLDVRPRMNGPCVLRPVPDLLPIDDARGPLRVLLASLAPGGAERIVLEWLEAERARGRDAELAVLHGRRHALEVPAGIRVRQRGAES